MASNPTEILKVADRKRKPRSKATALAVHLPGADSVDGALLDRAVQELNALYRTKGLETARAVAEVVIGVFFGGSVDHFNARSGSHISFVELKKRSDLHVSYQFVWNSCAVYDQIRQLPQHVVDALPMSHQKLLLPVKDREQKVALAQAAVKENLGKRAFEERIRLVRKAATTSKAGRPPLPAFAKAFTVVKRAVSMATKGTIDEDSFAHFSKDETRKHLDEWEQQVRDLAAVLAYVRLLVEK